MTYLEKKNKKAYSETVALHKKKQRVSFYNPAGV